MAEKEYIERKALGIGRCNPEVFENKAYADGWNSAIEIIESAPVSDVEPVRHGHWIAMGDCGVTKCSCCGWSIEECIEDKYCRECGAKMDGNKVE